MSSSKPLQLAFVGAGGITYAHQAAFETYPELVEIAGVSDPVLEAARKLSDGAPVAENFESLYEQIGDRLDGVIICTPHYLHHDTCAFFLERGVPVLVEKPAVCSLEELRHLQTLEEKHGTFVQAGQMQRFSLMAMWMRKFIQDRGSFGLPVSFGIDIWQNINGYIHGKADPWILDGARAGGGITISVGIHPLDLLRYVTGQDFVRVDARGRFDPPFTNGAESTCSALFQMSGGLTGTMHASYVVSRTPYSQRLMLFGERGSIIQDGGLVGRYEGKFQYASADPKIEGWGTMYTGFQSVDEEIEKAFPDAEPNQFSRQILHFREAILDRDLTRENSLAINFNTIATMDAVAESLRSGNAVDIPQNAC